MRHRQCRPSVCLTGDTFPELWSTFCPFLSWLIVCCFLETTDANAEVRTLSALVHPKWKLAIICSAEVGHTLLTDSFRFHSNFPSLCQSHHSAARANVCTYFGGVYSSYPAGIYLKTATQWPARSSCGLCTQPGKRPQASVPSWLTW